MTPFWLSVPRTKAIRPVSRMSSIRAMIGRSGAPPSRKLSEQSMTTMPARSTRADRRRERDPAEQETPVGPTDRQGFGHLQIPTMRIMRRLEVE